MIEESRNTAELYLGPPSDEESQNAEPRYHVKLSTFDGPLDLLLHLIRKSEFDIYDIPIASITQQYLDTLEIMRELDLNIAGDFVFMAATLIHIKSKMLLPPPHEDGVEDELGDPRDELVARLLEYQRYKEAAQMLYERQTLQSATWLRSETAVAPLLEADAQAQEELVDVDLYELLTAFRSVLERISRRKDIKFERETVTVEEMIQILSAKIAPRTNISFEQLFEDVTTRALLIVTFLALLELVRLRVFRVYQTKTFGPIHISRPDETVPPVTVPVELSETADSLEPLEAVEPVEPVDIVDAVEPSESGPAEPVEPVKEVELPGPSDRLPDTNDRSRRE
jgi:segregation and condensation protein A